MDEEIAVGHLARCVLITTIETLWRTLRDPRAKYANDPYLKQVCDAMWYIIKYGDMPAQEDIEREVRRREHDMS